MQRRVCVLIVAGLLAACEERAVVDPSQPTPLAPVSPAMPIVAHAAQDAGVVSATAADGWRTAKVGDFATLHCDFTHPRGFRLQSDVEIDVLAADAGVVTVGLARSKSELTASPYPGNRKQPHNLEPPPEALRVEMTRLSGALAHSAFDSSVTDAPRKRSVLTLTDGREVPVLCATFDGTPTDAPRETVCEATPPSTLYRTNGVLSFSQSFARGGGRSCTVVAFGTRPTISRRYPPTSDSGQGGFITGADGRTDSLMDWAGAEPHRK
jgi:hypothetical protein